MFKKFKVTFSLRGGQKIQFKCDRFDIEKQNNELVGYKVSGHKSDGDDPLFYVRLDAIDHIEVKALWNITW